MQMLARPVKFIADNMIASFAYHVISVVLGCARE